MRETGETAARRQGQPKGSKLDAHETFLLGLVAETRDITLAEMQARLAAVLQAYPQDAMTWARLGQDIAAHGTGLKLLRPNGILVNP